MEENFSMEWNMEWKIFSMEWKKIASMEYGKIVFHSIPCPGCKQPLVKVRQQYQDATTGIWYAYCTWFNA